MKRLAIGLVAVVLAGCQIERVHTPIEYPPKPKPRPRTVLEEAIWQRKNDELLAALRASPSGEIEDDGTANLLQTAVKAHNDKAVNMLLLHGADPNGPRYTWDTPLALAVKDNNLKLVKLLLMFNADPNKATPLGVIQEGEIGKQIARLLVARGADLNNRTWSDRILLIDAISVGDWKVKLLLDLGADPNYVGASGLTPLDAAFSKGKTSTVKLLESYGARLRRDFSEHGNKDFKQVSKILQLSGGKHGR